MMMSKTEADAWMRQEAEKIKTRKDAEAFLKNHRKSLAYYDSPVGQTQGRLQPHMRQARMDLADWVRQKFGLK